MHGYEDDIEYDDHEEEGEEQEGEDEEEAESEEEAERQPTKEELEYLELRQRLKESIRKKMKRGAASQNSEDSKGKLPYNNFGSFFGPSQPVIASRVIQESKSLLENQHLASRIVNSSHSSKKNVSSNSTKSKSGSNGKLQSRVSEVKRKVEKIKDTRDYSFLFSDDAELPPSNKEPQSRHNPRDISEAQAAQFAAKPRQPLGSGGRNADVGLEEKRSAYVNGQRHSRSGLLGSQRHSRPGFSSSQRHSRPGLSSSQMHSRPGSSGGQMHSRPGSSGSQMHSRPGTSSSQINARPGPSGGQRHLKSSTANGQISMKSPSQKSAPTRKLDSSSIDARKHQGSSNGIGLDRSVVRKPLPSKQAVTSMEKKVSAVPTKNHLQGSHRPSSSKMASDAKQRYEPRKVSHEPSRSQMVQKQSTAPAKHQMNKPLKRVASHDSIDDRRPKKKPVSEDEMAINMIRSMFKVDRYAGRGYDDDDSDMEANFEDILKEEKRSARIARKEDEEQLRLIEEEERRERMKKQAKKRKFG